MDLQELGAISAVPPEAGRRATFRQALLRLVPRVPGRFGDVDDFKPGLEGIVAFETEIAEPDREGGALRYRGVDIEELVGKVPYEQVWGLLVDDSFEPGMPRAEDIELPARTGSAMADLQAATAELGGQWELGQLIDISDEQARDDLARLSAGMISLVAQSARGDEDRVPDDVVAAGETAAERFLLRWRGEADPRHVRGDRHLLGLGGRARRQRLDLHRRASSPPPAPTAALRCPRRSARSRGRCTAVRPPAFSRCSTRSREAGDAERYVRDLLDRGERIMGFGHRVYRAEDPRARVLRRTAHELESPRVEVAEALEQAALEELQERHPERVLATNVEFWSAVVLDIAEIPPPLFPAMFACARVAGWSAHILEQKRTGRLIRPSAQLHRARRPARSTSVGDARRGGGSARRRS